MKRMGAVMFLFLAVALIGLSACKKQEEAAAPAAGMEEAAPAAEGAEHAE